MHASASGYIILSAVVPLFFGGWELQEVKGPLPRPVTCRIDGCSCRIPHPVTRVRRHEVPNSDEVRLTVLSPYILCVASEVLDKEPSTLFIIRYPVVSSITREVGLGQVQMLTIVTWFSDILKWSELLVLLVTIGFVLMVTLDFVGDFGSDW